MKFGMVTLNPSATSSYSGPTVLLNRLYKVLPGDVRLTGLLPRGGVWKLSGTQVHTEHLPVPDRKSMRGQILWALAARWWLRRHVSEIDFVHAHGAYLYSLLPLLGLSRSRVPYAIFPLAAGGDLAKDSRSGRIPGVAQLRRKIVSGASVGFALSDSIGDELQFWGLPSSRVMRVYNPVAPEYFDLQDVDLSSDSRHFRIGFVGKLGQRKQPHIILQALATLRSRGWVEATALFVGPFDNLAYRSYFWSEAERLDVIDHVFVTGYTEDVLSHLKTIGVFALPSRQEGLPGALGEALALGVPSAVSSAGAMPEVIGESGAGRVVGDDPVLLSDFVHELWTDGALYDRMSANASRFARDHFSEESVSRLVWSIVRRSAMM